MSHLDLELREFIDDEQIDLFRGESTACCEATRSHESKYDITANATLLTGFERKNMAAS
jgi:hypothetical protein